MEETKEVVEPLALHEGLEGFQSVVFMKKVEKFAHILSKAANSANIVDIQVYAILDTHGSRICFFWRAVVSTSNGGTSGYLLFVYQVSCYVFDCLYVTSCSSKLHNTFTFSLMFQEPHWKTRTTDK